MDSLHHASCKSRLRWRLLSRAIKQGLRVAAEEGSIRKFPGFGLVKIARITGHNNPDDQEDDLKKKLPPNESNSCFSASDLYECRLECDRISIDFKLFLPSSKIPIKELLRESDNTGNVHIWPSEEVLAYYLFKNKEMVSPKMVVCELGGGMTCLSGVIVAMACQPSRVLLTDGNQRCYENIKKMIQVNQQLLRHSNVQARQLKWGMSDDYDDLCETIDIILVSDCLYNCESHAGLLETIWLLLKNDGSAVVLAPARGNTFKMFVDLARKRFITEQIMVYDIEVWQIHERFSATLDQDVYNPDLHYPIMLLLRKSSNFQPD